MGRIFLLVGADDFLGSIASYLKAIWLTKQFPYGTFGANILGCLLIGGVYGFDQRFGWVTAELRLFLATGFCAGFITFSSFTLENANSLQISNYLTFAIYAISSFTVGLLAVLEGRTLTKIEL